MKISRLYIENFMCYDNAYIDLTQFSSALIVGKKENNDDVSNGVGKTTIFKAIEYCFFNYADVNLENIIRDEMEYCKITVDFTVNAQEYRVERARTRKGVTDLNLYVKNMTDSSDADSLYVVKKDKYYPVSDEKYWKGISGRRAADTEKELLKLLKVNIKSFRIFVHFMQHDFSGLTTATPEKRKAILRDALSLAIYVKLEKIAKEKLSVLSKEYDKFNVLISNLGNPDLDLSQLSSNLTSLDKELENKKDKAIELEKLQTKSNDITAALTTEHSNLENKFASLLLKEKNVTLEKSKLEISIKEYQTKKSNIIKSAHELVLEIKSLENTQSQLSKNDFSQIEILAEKNTINKELITKNSLIIQNDLSRLEKLKKPIPPNGECGECHQVITEKHRQICQSKLDQEKVGKQLNIKNLKKEISDTNNSIAINQQLINELNLSKQYLNDVNNKITTKKKELLDKRTFHDEFSNLLDKYNSELIFKKEEIEQINIELKASSLEEAQTIKDKIEMEKNNLFSIISQISLLNKEIAHISNNKAVVQHSFDQKVKDKNKKKEYEILLEELNKKIEIYPLVVQAFSSTGIPNLIIQNVLDDLQLEANNLLAQLKPGIQIVFSIEKTKDDGSEADTLDISYLVGGKKRYYEQLSGAMQLAVSFSLKLGLSFLLQNIMGVDIRFLLLDEIDQSLDKASVDAFADIVKFFQKDFTILVITHNDRLKDKFSHAILVEQDINMVSRASVVSSW